MKVAGSSIGDRLVPRGLGHLSFVTVVIAAFFLGRALAPVVCNVRANALVNHSRTSGMISGARVTRVSVTTGIDCDGDKL